MVKYKYDMNVVEINGVSKRYGKVEALNEISLQIAKGEIYGLIGPDGAGKSTLFRIMTSLIKPDKGSVKVLGFDSVNDYKEIRGRVGYMPGRFSLYQDLSVIENINLFATVFNTSLKENYRLIEDIYKQIEPFKNRRAGALSGGMKQKLALCCALIHKPDILFLDEPTTGVDPVSRREFWEILKRLNNEQITVIVSTPYMDEAKQCSKISLIREGKIIKTDSPEMIVADFKKDIIEVSSKNMFELLKFLRKLNSVDLAYTYGDNHHVILKDRISISDFESEIKSVGHEGLDFCCVKPTIEDFYIYFSNN